MFDKKRFENAKEIKGYGSYDKSVSDDEIESMKTLPGEDKLKVRPKIIRTLAEYINFIKEIESSYKNPVFYRGQTNADYLLTPNCLRINPKNEHLMINAFYRKFFDELNKCHTSMEKLAVMQHFFLPTRCLDISESPLMALYFACSHMKKFRTKIIKLNENGEEIKDNEEDDWGEIVLFKEPEDDEYAASENLKNVESSSISIIANTAFMEEDFSLWHLGARWKKDVDIGHDEKYIDLRSIVRRSYIVRVPQNNVRIKNQQGAFIMANANMAYIDEKENESKKLTEKIIASDYITYHDLIEKGYNLNETETWDLHFKKIKPYSDENELEIFRTDPFDLHRIFYKKNGVQQVILIPPKCKESILNELAKLNITEDFVYPDMDNVAHEISEQLNK